MTKKNMPKTYRSFYHAISTYLQPIQYSRHVEKMKNKNPTY
jgi:hypothetical protein